MKAALVAIGGWLLVLPFCCSEQTATSIFRDGAHGVSFRYPSTWKRSAMYPGEVLGLILPLEKGPAPLAGWDFQTRYGTFRYRVIEGLDEAGCANKVESDDPPKRVTIGVRKFLRGSMSVPVTGQSFEARVYASEASGECYLFEEDWPTHHGDIDGTPAWEAMERRAFAQMEAVMQSVRIRTPPVVPMDVYRDPETGVSFRYPAAWTQDQAATYGGNPLLEAGKETDQAADVRLSVGWVSVAVDPLDKTQGTAESVNFTYAVLPETTAEACAARFIGWDSDPTPVDGATKEPTLETVNGIPYHVIEDDEAGLGHSWKFVVYTTFYKGRCLGFSLGSETSHTDAPGRARRRSQAVSMDNYAVMQSVRM